VTDSGFTISEVDELYEKGAPKLSRSGHHH
jgi:hypothetical protein